MKWHLGPIDKFGHVARSAHGGIFIEIHSLAFKSHKLTQRAKIPNEIRVINEEIIFHSLEE